MDTAVLVERHIEDGRIMIKELLRRRWKIAAAFWNQDKESNEWKLFISVSLLRQTGSRLIYLRLTRAIREIQPRLTIDIDDIKLIEPSHGVVQTIKLLLSDDSSDAEITKYIHLTGDPKIIGRTICYVLKNLSV